MQNSNMPFAGYLTSQLEAFVSENAITSTMSSEVMTRMRAELDRRAKVQSEKAGVMA